MINWQQISGASELEGLLSTSDTVILFKHSERCVVSRMAKRSFEAEYDGATPVYLVNVIEERPISNQIAQVTHITHQSPQVLVIKGGQCVFHVSHDHINAEEVKKHL
ncbi:MAG: bacillithiol system redox-active protein YtxJ [Bacteroidota bacterium]|jgi:bacillithiol system protein YtxJ